MRLDPQPAMIAEHGQLASAARDGLVISATKQLREGFRVRMLLIPGLLRVLVELDEDTVRMSCRSVDGVRLHWRTAEQTRTLESGAESFGVDAPCVMRTALRAEQDRATYDVRLVHVVTPLADRVHTRVTSRADVFQVVLV